MTPDTTLNKPVYLVLQISQIPTPGVMNNTHNHEPPTSYFSFLRFSCFTPLPQLHAERGVIIKYECRVVKSSRRDSFGRQSIRKAGVLALRSGLVEAEEAPYR